MINATHTNRVSTPQTKAPAKEYRPKDEQEHITDRYNVSRTTANIISGAMVRGATETASSVLQSPVLAAEIVENLWQAETIGPNLKILGTLAALPAAALSIPVAPFYGAVVGGIAGAEARKESGLRQDANTNVASSLFINKTDEHSETGSMSGKLIQSLEKLGAEKLEVGEKPFDIPLLTPLFSVTGGLVSGAISGVVGLVAGLVAGAVTTGKEMVGAFTGSDKSMGERVGQFVAAPLHTVVMGPALAWSGIKEATPRGFKDGWNHGPFKPVIDTTKASVALASDAIQKAWER